MKFKNDIHFYKFCKMFINEGGADFIHKHSVARVELAQEFDYADATEFPIPFSEAAYEFANRDIEQKCCAYFDRAEMPEGAWDLLMDCTLIGDGDCPECGGKMCFDHGDYDYDEEDGHRVDFDIFRCEDCGHEEQE